MKSLFSARGFLLALSLAAIAALVLLASGLDAVHFGNPTLYRPEQTETVRVSVADLFEQIASVPMWKQVLFWAGIFLIVLLLSSLLTPEMRKRLLWAVFRMALFVLAIVYIIQNRERFGLTDFNQFPTANTAGPAPEALPPLPDFAAPNLPPGLVYLLSVAILLVAFGLLWFFGRGFLALGGRPAQGAELDDIAAAARLSLDDLAAGRNWEDSIIRCYARMSEAVSRHRGLRRDVAMTPYEFASRLEQSGLPADSVQRLTRLFESVRYGARSAEVREREEASACLTDILRHCGEAV